MESIRPQDRPKMIALLVCVVIVFGYVFMQLYKGLNPGAGSSDPAAVAATTDPAATEATAPVVEEGLIEVPALFASATLNPFAKVLPDASQVRSEPVRTRSNIPSAGWAQDVTMPETMPGTLGGGSIEPVQVAAQEPIEEALPPVKLKGIIYGKNPVAVVEVGSTEYIVEAGQPLEGGYTVKSIKDNRIELQHGKVKTNLNLATE